MDQTSRAAFRLASRRADQWARQYCISSASVTLNHYYLEALGSTGCSLRQHFPSLRALTLRQATAGRKPLPPEVVRACLELLVHGSGNDGTRLAGRISCFDVRQLVLQDWPASGVEELLLLVEAFPRLEELALRCRTRAFPHHFVPSGDLLPCLASIFPHLRRLELRGLGLLQHHASTCHPSPPPPPPAPHSAALVAGPDQPPPPNSPGIPAPAVGACHKSAAAMKGGTPEAGGPSLHGGSGLRSLSRLPYLQHLALGTVDLPAPLCAELGCLSQLLSLELDMWWVMTPADELRALSRSVGRSLARLKQLRELTLRVTCCVEEVEQDQGEGEDGAGGLEGQRGGAEGGTGGAGEQEEEEEENEEVVESGAEGAPRPGGLMTEVLRAMTSNVRQGGASRVVQLRLPGHPLQLEDWRQVRRLRALRRLDVGQLAPACVVEAQGRITVVAAEQQP